MTHDDLYEAAARMVEARGIGNLSASVAAWFRGRKGRDLRSSVVGTSEPERPSEGAYALFKVAAPCRRQEAVYAYALADRPDIAIQWVNSRKSVCADCNCQLPVPS